MKRYYARKAEENFTRDSKSVSFRLVQVYFMFIDYFQLFSFRVVIVYFALEVIRIKGSCAVKLFFSVVI